MVENDYESRIRTKLRELNEQLGKIRQQQLALEQAKYTVVGAIAALRGVLDDGTD